MTKNNVMNRLARHADMPLGMGVGDGLCVVQAPDCFGVRPKLWIAAAIGAAASIASAIAGSVRASKAAKEAERKQKQAEEKENAWYNRRYNEDYVDTAAGQNLVRRAKEYARENWKKAAGAQAVGGGTAAATQMAKDAGNKMVGDTIADIAASDQMRKARVDDMHRQAESKFAQMDIDREMQRAQNITNAGQNASNALMSVGGAVDQMGSKTNLKGVSNNGSPWVPVSGGGKVYSNGSQVVNLTDTDAGIQKISSLREEGRW